MAFFAVRFDKAAGNKTLKAIIDLGSAFLSSDLNGAAGSQHTDKTIDVGLACLGSGSRYDLK